MSPNTTNFSQLAGDSKATAMVQSRWVVAEKVHNKQVANWDQWFRMFKCERVNSNYDGLSNIVVPKVFEKVIRGTAVINQAIKKIKVNGQEENDKESAELNEELIDFENRVLEFKNVRDLWVQSARIYGTAYTELTWDMGKEEEDRPYKGLDWQQVPGEQLRFNPDHVVGEPFRWVIRQIEVPFNDVRKMMEKDKSFNKDQLAAVKGSSHLGSLGSPLGGKTKKGGVDMSDDTTLMVTLKRYYGPYSPEVDGDEEDYLIIVANDAHAIKVVESPYAKILDDPIPVFELPIYPVPGEPYAMGDPAAIASLYTELNDTRNQRMDTVTLNIDPMKVILKAAQIDEKELIARKGWVVHSNMPNAVEVIRPDMQGVRASIDEEKIIQGDIDRTLGIPSFGAKTPVMGDISQDTATGVNAMLAAQDVVSNFILSKVKLALRKVYRAILAYNQEFIDRNFKISVLGKEGPELKSVSNASIKGNLDVDIEVELMGDLFMRRQEALAALNIGKGIPGSNMAKLWEDFLNTYDRDNFEDYYQEPQPVPPEDPKISVSLKTSELNELQTAEIYKQIPGVNPKFADPLMTKEGRAMMRGDLPEFQDTKEGDRTKETEDRDFKLREKQGEQIKEKE